MQNWERRQWKYITSVSWTEGKTSRPSSLLCLLLPTILWISLKKTPFLSSVYCDLGISHRSGSHWHPGNHCCNQTWQSGQTDWLIEGHQFEESECPSAARDQIRGTGEAYLQVCTCLQARRCHSVAYRAPPSVTLAPSPWTRCVSRCQCSVQSKHTASINTSPF